MRVFAALAVAAGLAVIGRATRSSDAAPAAPPDATASVTPGRALDRLGSDDAQEVDRAVSTITRLPGHEADPDILFAAARACEDRLLDPGRAVAIYDRIVAQHPTARVAIAATQRAAALRALIGPNGETATLAAELARLTAFADTLPADAVIRRAGHLATAAWPGAPTAALWLADWLRRAGRLAEAQAHYAGVALRWPDLPQAHAALRGAAGCAIDAHDWSLAEALAQRLPATNAAEKAVRDELLAAAAHEHRRARWYVAAWLAIAVALATLLGSLLEAALRSPPGSRWSPQGEPSPQGDSDPCFAADRNRSARLGSSLRPPIEILFLGPVAAVLIGVAFTAQRLIAPAVATIAGGGLALAWLSGAALEQLRARGRSWTPRSIAHVVVCLAGVAALGYVALHQDHLLDLLLETVRFGPET